MRIMIINGPNLNMLGIREPHIYGSTTLDAIKAACEEFAAFAGAQLSFHQSNHEGELVDLIHAARGRAAAIVINAGAFNHYAWSLHDALAAFDGPIVELHLSNPSAREAWRSRSVVAPVATGVIAGFGGPGYRLAIEAVAGLLNP